MMTVLRPLRLCCVDWQATIRIFRIVRCQRRERASPVNVSALPHVYRELVNRLHDTAIKCAGTQQLRERISRVLGDVITPYHHKQAEKSGLERCHLEAALNIKPGHTLGIIDALLVHKMAGLYCRWWTLVIQARVKYESCRSHQTP